MFPPRSEPIQVIRFDPIDATSAFLVHTTLLKAELADPDLSKNEHWREQRDIAFARFRAAFEVA